jgi:hypothetical protein
MHSLNGIFVSAYYTPELAEGISAGCWPITMEPYTVLLKKMLDPSCSRHYSKYMLFANIWDGKFQSTYLIRRPFSACLMFKPSVVGE